MKRILFLSLLMAAISPALMAQEGTDENIRTGWTFGALPSVSFDADLGFQYGALANIYYFGDGSTYPEYLHSIYVEASRTTTRYGLLRFYYDSKHLIPDHRVSLDISYMPDPMSPFFGFNGFQSYIHPEWIDKENANYITRAFYSMKRNLFRVAADLQGPIAGHFTWDAGFGLLDYEIGSFDVDQYNSRRNDPDKMLPDTTTLYDSYIHRGFIKANEANGGFHPYVHGGVTYDSRNRQQNPQHGIYADAFLTYSAAFGDQSEYNNLKLNAAWRQYISLDRNSHLILAYRLGAQVQLAGNSPFYADNYMNQLYWQRCIYEGLGGASSLRGVLRNRILADGFAYGNVELRIQFYHFKIGKENFYLGLNPFVDAGMVLQAHNDFSDIFLTYYASQDMSGDLEGDLHRLHLGAGCGLKVCMNDNFVVSVDWGTPFDEQDNYKSSNLYIKIGYMF